MYQALYRKYRPKLFKDLVGQKVIVKTLENSILNNKLSHAYLFTGPRGTGKTSTAKIFAKIINCNDLNSITPCEKCNSCIQFNNNQNIDIIEIDAASNNGVDEIRELREKINLVPSFGKYKVYIIDEVHMLTTAAFNALLKTLEEPPKHIVFILATTEPHKIPTTILSRCQRFDFKKINEDDIKIRLKFICDEEKINITDESIELIAKLSDGGMRDSINLLDQLTSYAQNKITLEDVHDVFGTITNEEISNFLETIVQKNIITTLNLISKYDSSGKNLYKIMELIILFLKNCLIYTYSSNFFENSNEKKLYNNICKKISEEEISQMIEIFLDVIKSEKNSLNIKLLFELCIIKIFDKTRIESDKYKKTENIVSKDENKTSTNKQINMNIDESVKKIRINNTLSLFNKKEYTNFLNELNELKDSDVNIENSSIISLIMDGKLKAKGEQYLIFVYDDEHLSNYFNTSLNKIEKILNEIFKENFKPIAVSSDEWEIIKKDFNESLKNNKQKYKYIKEENKETLENLSNNKKGDSKVAQLFENIIQYN